MLRRNTQPVLSAKQRPCNIALTHLAWRSSYGRVLRFKRATTERTMRACFNKRLASPADGVAPHGEVWSLVEDGAWAPRPPPRGSPARLSTFGRVLRGRTRGPLP